jgi:3-hydroxybutyryl-CoA dehydrogenase
MSDIKSIGVVGAGQMGHGIAQVAAVSGYEVTLSDISEDALEAGLASVQKSLNRFVSKEKMTAEDRDAGRSRSPTLDDFHTVTRGDGKINPAV